jgi:uncharacterized 2Fe-2S/4Fe-4S cluster protein (DUF4445 family)
MSDVPGEHSIRLEVEASGERHVFTPALADQSAALSDVLRRAGLPLNTRCGGRGLCYGCLIELVDGHLTRVHAGQTVSAMPGGAPSIVRACEYSMNGSAASIRIPLRSSLRHRPQIVSDYQIGVSFSHDPLYQQLRVPHADLARGLAQAIGHLRPGLPIRISPRVDETILPRGDLYADLEHRGDHRLVTRISQLPEGIALGAAVDIGTTTVALLLVNLLDGEVISRASKFNEQMHAGDDVVTRINLCSSDPAMLNRLHQAVTSQTILPLLKQAIHEAGRSADEVRCMVFTGNTTMLHILAGVDPTPMGVAPFTPGFLAHRVMNASEIFDDSPLPPQMPCHLLPSAAAYIGADLTAGIVATGLLYDPGPSLLVDAGTNGEIILKRGEQLLGCATAAGPAFEGAGLSCGMRAVEGAISRVTITADPASVHCEVIGGPGTHPIGICGSAYVDFLASARAAGILTETGRFNLDAVAGLGDRIIPWDGREIAFRLASGTGRQPIVISEHDIASLLQAKAAIAAGILTLLDQFHLRPQDIRNVYLAGGFGTNMDRWAAISCGLLPGFTPEKICPVGNTSLAGAFLSLMDTGLLAETCAAATQTRVIELNLDPNFEARYIDQLSVA